jgi:small-conductance mechanosensitive channel
MPSPAPVDRRMRMRRLMLIRLVFLVPLLIAVFVLHVSGTALVAVHIARILVIALAVVIAAGMRSRRGRVPRSPQD